ncbi:MAG: cyclic nucleotide-binding domain-containing protein [Flexibacter sp. CG_4_10_14_3_um_filter_32_15]|nr:MAG: cyclic nucleotide-binding domain-containing protein [Flexibacter sp. CG_4_10_14_3_um_filter_32_15]
MWNPFARKYSSQDKILMNFLRKMLLFSCLTDEELMVFLPNLYTRNYSKDEIVFFRNDPSQALYIVKSGQIRLDLDIGERFEELGKVKTGGFFGENCLVQGSNRLYNAICCDAITELYILPLANILEIFEEYPRIKSKMYEMMAQHQQEHIQNLFNAYREAFGIFELSHSYFKN